MTSTEQDSVPALAPASGFASGTAPWLPSVWPALGQLVRATGVGRDRAIDIGRVIAIGAVVAIHTVDASHYTLTDGEPDLRFAVDAGQVIDQLARFAVPFFFMASGYFLARKNLARVDAALRDILLRIAWPYLVWTVLFNLTNPHAFMTAHDNPVGFVMRVVLQGGAAPHLWFLPSLAICLALLVIGVRLLSLRALLAVGLVLYIAGLCVGSYAFVVFGRPASAMQLHLARDAPSFGFVFVTLGYWLGRHRIRPALPLALAVLTAGGALHFAEALGLAARGIHPIVQNDYLLGTLPFGIGAFLVALAWPRHWLGPAWLAAIGSCSLGLYALHPAFVLVLGPLFHPEALSARIAIWAVSLVASAIIVVEMTRFRPLRQLVR